MCGFSNMACQILSAYGALLSSRDAAHAVFSLPTPACRALCPGFLHPCCIAVAAQYTTETADPGSADTSTADVDFQSRNVLVDPELREAIKKFSNWPTIPQVLPHSTTCVVRKLPPESLAAWSRPAILLAARLGRPPVKCWRSSRCIRSDDALWPLTCSCTSRGSLWAGATS